MTDCNGATIGVGDVVEVVDEFPVRQGVIDELHSTDPNTALVDFSGRAAWYDGSELRLVRRKEKA